MQPDVRSTTAGSSGGSSTSAGRLGACAVWPGCAAGWWARACVPAACWASAGCGACWVRVPGRSASSPPLQPPGNLCCAAAPGTGTDVEPPPVRSGRKTRTHHIPSKWTLWQATLGTREKQGRSNGNSLLEMFRVKRQSGGRVGLLWKPVHPVGTDFNSL